jgi:hypothetical protein
VPPEYRKIVDEIYTVLKDLNAPPLLLGIAGSWATHSMTKRCWPL